MIRQLISFLAIFITSAIDPIYLDSDQRLAVSWEVLGDGKCEVLFTLHITGHSGWAALGFGTGMLESDIMMVSYTNDFPLVVDRNTYNFTRRLEPEVDDNQNLNIYSMERLVQGTTTTVSITWSRECSTGDADDAIISLTEPTNIIWAYGQGSADAPSYHDDSGATTLEFKYIEPDWTDGEETDSTDASDNDDGSDLSDGVVDTADNLADATDEVGADETDGNIDGGATDGTDSTGNPECHFGNGTTIQHGEWGYYHPDATHCSYCQCDSGEAISCTTKPMQNCEPCHLYDCGHGSCNATNGTASCICEPGFSGSRCQNVDICAQQVCGVGKVCVPKDDTFECVCPDGRYGPTCNTTCPDDACNLRGSCTPSPHPSVNRTFVCSCAANWAGLDCELPNPCNMHQCENDGKCITIINWELSGYSGRRPTVTADKPLTWQARCLCRDGHAGPHCADTDPCKHHNCTHGSSCVANGETYTCQCHGVWGGVTCNVACADNTCNGHGMCTETGYDPIPFVCHCEDGWVGAQCNEPTTICDGKCNGGGCTALTTTTYKCNCTSTRLGANCQYVNPCTETPCQHGQCVVHYASDMPTGMHCDCNDNWFGDLCDSRCPVENPCGEGACVPYFGGDPDEKTYACVCTGTGKQGLNCELDDPCTTANPCKNGGVCNSKTNLRWGIVEVTCECVGQYTGDHCEFFDNCLNRCDNGFCFTTSAPPGYNCMCYDGWFGPQCDSRCPTDNACSGHGTCIPNTKGYTCDCDDLYEGLLCQTTITCPVWQCSGHGSCKANQQCDCRTPYIGTYCELEDPCLLTPCYNGATCVPEVEDNEASFHCVCPPDFKGATCKVHDPCLLSPCQHNGTCALIDTPGNLNDFKCTCKSGWYGPLCSMNCNVARCNGGSCAVDGSCNCTAGKVGANCQYTDPCLSKQCQNNGTCTVTMKGSTPVATCNCVTPFTGSSCEIADPCHVYPSPCHHGSCHKINGTHFTCACEPIAVGTLCDDVCKVKQQQGGAVCQHGGVCYNDRTVAKFYGCDCPEGWKGEHCEVKDCNPRCVNGECLDGEHCTCAQGYAGVACDIADVCLTQQPCYLGTCRNTDESPMGYVCNCDPDTYGMNCTYQCPPDMCNGHGQCFRNGIGSPPMCECEPGYGGMDCSGEDTCLVNDCHPNDGFQSCFPVTPAEFDSVLPGYLEGFDVQASVQPYTCMCGMGLSGEKCEIFDPCLPVYCGNGQCVADFDEDGLPIGVCQCEEGFHGEHCTETCQDWFCGVGGVCEDYWGGWECTCKAGYMGSLCDIDDPCVGVECNHGYCSAVLYTAPPEPVCECYYPYKGTAQCDVLDYCNPSPCVHGTCVGTATGFDCKCDPDYVGARCERFADGSLPCELVVLPMEAYSNGNAPDRHPFFAVDGDTTTYFQPAAGTTKTELWFRVAPYTAPICEVGILWQAEYGTSFFVEFYGTTASNITDSASLSTYIISDSVTITGVPTYTTFYPTPGLSSILLSIYGNAAIAEIYVSARAPPNACDTFYSCGVHSVCKMDEITYQPYCFCTDGWTGEFCDDGCGQLGDETRCHSHGTCSTAGESYACSCSNGWIGATCRYEDPCPRADCGSGTCVADWLYGEYTCACDATKVGRACEISKAQARCREWALPGKAWSSSQKGLNGPAKAVDGTSAFFRSDKVTDDNPKLWFLVSKTAVPFCQLNIDFNSGMQQTVELQFNYSISTTHYNDPDTYNNALKPLAVYQLTAANPFLSLKLDVSSLTGIMIYAPNAVLSIKEISVFAHENSVGTCTTTPCVHGNCYVTATGPTCQCESGWFGDKCDDPCGSDSRALCSYQGTCVSKSEGFTCECDDGFNGPLCDYVDPCGSCPIATTDNCEIKIALNGGVMVDDVTGLARFVCHCKSGWSGKFCSFADRCLAESPCTGHGVCSTVITGTVSVKSCACSAGWSGESCQNSPCPTNTCNAPHGTCVETTQSFTGFKCTCNTGYTGLLCDNNSDKCAGKLCSSRGVCHPVTGKCICDSGWLSETECFLPDPCNPPEGIKFPHCDEDHTTSCALKRNYLGELQTRPEDGTARFECSCHPDWTGNRFCGVRTPGTSAGKRVKFDQLAHESSTTAEVFAHRYYDNTSHDKPITKSKPIITNKKAAAKKSWLDTLHALTKRAGVQWTIMAVLCLASVAVLSFHHARPKTQRTSSEIYSEC